MKLRYIDAEGYFAEGYYDAEIMRIEPYKTIYGQRLMIWMKIKNEFEKEMMINDIIPEIVTGYNLLAKIFKIVLHTTEPDRLETDDLIGKFIGISLVKQIRKKKSYLNVTNFMPIKAKSENGKASTEGNIKELSATISQLLLQNPGLSKLVAKTVKQKAHTVRKKEKHNDIKSLGDVMREEQQDK